MRDHQEAQRQRDKETGSQREQASAAGDSGREPQLGGSGEGAREAECHSVEK